MKKLLTIALILIASISASAQGLADGTKAPDFTLPDASGKMVSLSSLQGKWVVLDFWGSWCGWCIKGFPQMKENYKELNDRVTFVGVDCGDKQETWKAALKKHDLPWLNLWNNPETGKELLSTYAIQGFPTKLIIDPEGIIRNTTIGENPAFYDTLRELLK